MRIASIDPPHDRRCAKEDALLQSRAVVSHYYIGGFVVFLYINQEIIL